MDLGIKNKVALVMGSSAGIGLGVAEALVKEGAKVVLCARTPDSLNRAKEKIGAALAIPCDLQKEGAAKALVAEVQKSLGPIDILVTNTGGPPKGQFKDITSDGWKTGFQGLWMSAVDGIQAVLPSMIERKWGRIILITSAAAKEPMAGLTVSNGLRAGLLGLTKSLCHEVAQYNITVNALLPGYTETERLKELGIQNDKIIAQIPAKRLASVEELASLAAYLSSESAGYITGQAIAVDGGYLKGI